MSRVDMRRAAVTERLRHVAMHSDLRSDRRLAAKIDYGPEAITARLRQVEQLRRLCLMLSRAEPMR